MSLETSGFMCESFVCSVLSVVGKGKRLAW